MKIKFCGLTRQEDIASANTLLPEYIGFVFAEKSRRYIAPEHAALLKKKLDPHISTVGVFVNESPEIVANLLNNGTIDLAQLHGNETEDYIRHLRTLTDRPIIRAFGIQTSEDIDKAIKSSADFILLDAMTSGGGKVFDWKLLMNIDRPFFLAGGLHIGNIGKAIDEIAPYAVDISSGIETNGLKDHEKMRELIDAVRGRKNPS